MVFPAYRCFSGLRDKRQQLFAIQQTNSNNIIDIKILTSIFQFRHSTGLVTVSVTVRVIIIQLNTVEFFSIWELRRMRFR